MAQAVLPATAVALNRAPTCRHHRPEILDRHSGARHGGARMLHGHSIENRELEGVVDIATQTQHAEPVALKDCAALRVRDGKTVQIPRWILPEQITIAGKVKRFAKHVQVIPQPVVFAIEDIGPGDVVIIALDRKLGGSWCWRGCWSGLHGVGSIQKPGQRGRDA